MSIRKIIGVLVMFSLIVSVITGCGTIDSQRKDGELLRLSKTIVLLNLRMAKP